MERHLVEKRGGALVRFHEARFGVYVVGWLVD
jgi:hypothetical protein